MTHADTFDAFEASAKSAGFTEVLKKDWQSSLALDTHTHPFDVQAQVVAGELWLKRSTSRQVATSHWPPMCLMKNATAPLAPPFGLRGDSPSHNNRLRALVAYRY